MDLLVSPSKMGAPSGRSHVASEAYKLKLGVLVLKVIPFLLFCLKLEPRRCQDGLYSPEIDPIFQYFTVESSTIATLRLAACFLHQLLAPFYLGEDVEAM